MSLFPTIYRSTDAGAPQISGQAGSLVALLDALLVDGYGEKGSLGWVRERSGLNVRAFRNSPVTGSGYRLRVDDAPAQFAWLRGFESMVSIDTGAGLVPTMAQRANGCLWIKSSAANTDSRPWFAVGNERCFYLFIRHQGGGVNNDVAYFAGDIASYVPGDRHCFAVTQNNLNSYSSGFGASQTFQAMSSTWDGTPSATNSSLYVARNRQGVEGAVLLAPAPAAAIGIAGPYGGGIDNDYYTVPAPVNGGVISVPGVLLEGKYVLRGEYPGIRAPISTLLYGDQSEMDEWLISKRFRVSASAGSSTQYIGEVLFELGKEWL